MTRRPLALFAACAAAAALAYAALVKGPRAGPLDAVPAASYLVAELDVEALRASALAPMLENERTLGSIGDLALACGFDPLGRIRELDLAIPEGGDPGDFGLAASATLTQDELVRCAENVAGTRGEARRVEQLGRFYLSDDGRGHALAVKDDGPILVGKTPWVRAMIEAAERRAPSLRANADHMALRDALSSASPTKPVLVVTVLLPRELRERLKKEMGAEANDANANVTMAGVLGVSAAGVAVRIAQDGLVDARAELRCESESACAEVAKLVLVRRLAWSQDLALRIVGLGPLIDGLEVNAHGASVTATTRAHAADLGAALERIAKLRARERKTGPPHPPVAAPEAPTRNRAPDEVLRPARKP
jgi:hypothetical protein